MGVGLRWQRQVVHHQRLRWGRHEQPLYHVWPVSRMRKIGPTARQNHLLGALLQGDMWEAALGDFGRARAVIEVPDDGEVRPLAYVHWQTDKEAVVCGPISVPLRVTVRVTNQVLYDVSPPTLAYATVKALNVPTTKWNRQIPRCQKLRKQHRALL